MDILNLIFKLCVIATPLMMVAALIYLEEIKDAFKQANILTIKNQKEIMAKLSDFQDVAGKIDDATKTIAAYVQGSGMSAAEQDQALKTIQDATANLTAAIPAATVADDAQAN